MVRRIENQFTAPIRKFCYILSTANPLIDNFEAAYFVAVASAEGCGLSLSTEAVVRLAWKLKSSKNKLLFKEESVVTRMRKVTLCPA